MKQRKTERSDFAVVDLVLIPVGATLGRPCLEFVVNSAL